MTRSAGLSVGDRACLGLAKELDLPVVTADRMWASLDLGIEIELIR
jgi:PIN domain nuclease of toxin-antitoxin system